VAGQIRRITLNEENIQRTEATLAQMAAPLETQLKSLPAPTTKKDKKGKKTTIDPAAGQRDSLNKQLAVIRQARSQLSDLKRLQSTFAQAKLQARVRYLDDNTLVDLLDTK
jgi:hypothetical protein